MTTVLAEQSMAASFLRWLNVSEPALGGPFTDRERQLVHHLHGVGIAHGQHGDLHGQPRDADLVGELRLLEEERHLARLEARRILEA